MGDPAKTVTVHTLNADGTEGETLPPVSAEKLPALIRKLNADGVKFRADAPPGTQQGWPKHGPAKPAPPYTDTPAYEMPPNAGYASVPRVPRPLASLQPPAAAQSSDIIGNALGDIGGELGRQFEPQSPRPFHTDDASQSWQQTARDAGRGLATGATLGAAPYLSAALGIEGHPGEPFAARVEEARANNTDAQRRSPFLYGLSNLGGSLLTGGAASKGIAAAARGLGGLGEAAANVGGNAALGGTQGLLSGNGRTRGEALSDAATGAAIGGGMAGLGTLLKGGFRRAPAVGVGDFETLPPPSRSGPPLVPPPRPETTLSLPPEPSSRPTIPETQPHEEDLDVQGVPPPPEPPAEPVESPTPPRWQGFQPPNPNEVPPANPTHFGFPDDGAGFVAPPKPAPAPRVKKQPAEAAKPEPAPAPPPVAEALAHAAPPEPPPTAAPEAGQDGDLSDLLRRSIAAAKGSRVGQALDAAGKPPFPATGPEIEPPPPNDRRAVLQAQQDEERRQVEAEIAANVARASQPPPTAAAPEPGLPPPPLPPGPVEPAPVGEQPQANGKKPRGPRVKPVAIDVPPHARPLPPPLPRRASAPPPLPPTAHFGAEQEVDPLPDATLPPPTSNFGDRFREIDPDPGATQAAAARSAVPRSTPPASKSLPPLRLSTEPPPPAHEDVFSRVNRSERPPPPTAAAQKSGTASRAVRAAAGAAGGALGGTLGYKMLGPVGAGVGATMGTSLGYGAARTAPNAGRAAGQALKSGAQALGNNLAPLGSAVNAGVAMNHGDRLPDAVHAQLQASPAFGAQYPSLAAAAGDPEKLNAEITRLTMQDANFRTKTLPMLRGGAH